MKLLPFLTLTCVSLLSFVISDQGCTPKIFAATYKASDSYHATVSVSNDGGKSFSTLLETTEGIYSFYAVDDNLYVGHISGLSVSNDGGHKWTTNKMGWIKSVYAINNQVFAVGYPSSFFHSSDSGVTWNTANLPNDIGPYGVYAAGGRSFVGSEAGLYLTDDFGKSWKVGNDNAMSALSGTDNKVFGVGMYTTEFALYFSADKGDTWAYQKVPGDQFVLVTSVFVADAKVYAGSAGSGLAFSSDLGRTWQVKTSVDGLINDNINTVSAAGSNVVIGTDQGISISSDGGATWVSKTTSNTPGLPSNNTAAVFVQCK